MQLTRHSRTAHDSHLSKICYRHHPCYGVEVEIVRYLRRTSPAILVVRLPDEQQLAVPEWMLSPLVCEQLKEEAEPRIAIAALQELRRLLDIQPLVTRVRKPRCCAESSAGGAHAQQQECWLSAEKTSLRDRTSLGRASRADTRKLSKPVPRTAGDCSPEERTEAE